MNHAQFAQLLGTRQMGEEITPEEAALAKTHGLVVMFGAGDDVVQIRGAIKISKGVHKGRDFNITPIGLLPSWSEFTADGLMCSESSCRAYFEMKDKGVHQITANQPDKGPWDWTFTTTIPHSTFDVFDDKDESFCQGIVFSLAELEPTTQASFLTEDPDHAQEGAEVQA
jgi:hypothetical protein